MDVYARDTSSATAAFKFPIAISSLFAPPSSAILLRFKFRHEQHHVVSEKLCECLHQVFTPKSCNHNKMRRGGLGCWETYARGFFNMAAEVDQVTVLPSLKNLTSTGFGVLSSEQKKVGFCFLSYPLGKRTSELWLNSV